MTSFVEQVGEISEAIDAKTWPIAFLVYVVACWAIAYDAKLVLKFMPPIPSLFGAATAPSAISLYQMLPKTKHVSWQLGHLAGQAQVLSAQSKLGPAEVNTQLSELTQQAASLIGVPAGQVDAALLQQLGGLIAEAERPSGAMARVRSLFNLANFLWMIGILGVAVSIGPAAIALFGPAIRALLAWAHTGALLAHYVARPLYPALALYACTALVAAAHLQPAPAGSRLALGGVVLATLALALFMALHAPDPPPPNTDPVLILNTFLVLCLVPLAHAHGSQLLGFFAAAALFGALGFSVIPMGLGWAVGWANEDTMLNTAAASGCLLALAAAARTTPQGTRLLAPFQLGVSVFGTLCLLLAGLIRTSRWYPTKPGAALGYVGANVGYAALLLAMVAWGALGGSMSVYSTAATFTALYLSDKAVEWCVFTGLGWVAVLLVSVGLCGGAWFIHTHPTWLVSMLR